MPTVSPASLSGRFLCFVEREGIAVLQALLRCPEPRHDRAVISARAQIAVASPLNATTNRRFVGSSAASS
jgi:hypothetical protein